MADAELEELDGGGAVAMDEGEEALLGDADEEEDDEEEEFDGAGVLWGLARCASGL